MLRKWAGTSARSPQDELAKSLSQWLRQRGYDNESAQHVFGVRSRTPIEDGFFTCLCVTNGALTVPREIESAGRFEWDELSPDSSEIGRILVEFIRGEHQRVDEPATLLHELYGADRDAKKSGNRKFFDNAYAHMEFAASVLSKDQLRFWSRPVNWPQ
jgi:hypothetical protein